MAVVVTAGAACAGELISAGSGVAAFTFCAGTAGNGAPTEISHRCPGCPCAGFSLAVGGVDTIFPPGAGFFLAGVADGVSAGKEIGLVAVVPGPYAFFSSQELKAAKQKTKGI